MYVQATLFVVNYGLSFLSFFSLKQISSLDKGNSVVEENYLRPENYLKWNSIST